jgi:hypothetical protein
MLRLRRRVWAGNPALPGHATDQGLGEASPMTTRAQRREGGRARATTPSASSNLVRRINPYPVNPVYMDGVGFHHHLRGHGLQLPRRIGSGKSLVVQAGDPPAQRRRVRAGTSASRSDASRSWTDCASRRRPAGHRRGTSITPALRQPRELENLRRGPACCRAPTRWP